MKKGTLGGALARWLIACLSFVLFIIIFGDIGILFGVALAYILAKY